MNWKMLHSDLVAYLDSMPADTKGTQVLGYVQQWLHRALTEWSSQLRARYGLDEYATIELGRFPVDENTLVLAEALRQLRAVPPGSMETFAMFLRDLFWEGITTESSIECPRCGDALLRVLEDPVSEDTVLACDICAWAQTPGGEPWDKDIKLRPAAAKAVAQWR